MVPPLCPDLTPEVYEKRGYMIAAFCFVCGSTLRTMYPGNNPENGPAGKRCMAGHPTVQEHAEQRLSDVIFRDRLEDLTQPILGEEDPPSVEVVTAAKTILKYLL